MDELIAIREAFPAPPDPDAAMLARAEARLDIVIHVGKRRRSRRRSIVLAAAALALLGAGFAAAATTGLFDRDVTEADLQARLQTVTETVSKCRAPGDCETPRVETVGEISLEGADGVLFVDPDGQFVQIVPAENTIGADSGSAAFRAARQTIELGGGRSHVDFALQGGGTRTIAWTAGEGTVEVTDRFADGSTTETTLHSGDVVPLLPGTLDDQPYTPDKSVMVDLDFGHGEGYPLWIYPQRNEAFAGQEPWRSPRATPLVLPAATVSHYGLVTISPGHYTLPATPAGGTWTYPLSAGGTRTIEWVAGDSAVTVTDRGSSGDEIGSEVVPIGRQFSAG